MTTLGIIGSRNITKDEAEIVRKYFVDFLEDSEKEKEGIESVFYDKVMFTNAYGVEEIVKFVLEARQRCYESIPLLRYSWEGPGGFKAANVKIINNSDLVLLILAYKDKTHGPDWAIKQLKYKRKPYSTFRF